MKFGIGQPVRRREDPRLLTGAGPLETPFTPVRLWRAPGRAG